MEEPQSKIISMPSDDEMKVAFETYTMALGKVAFAWNFLHERLGTLFQTLLDAPSENAKAVWYSTENDRTKQQMFKAVVMATSDARMAEISPAAKNDLLWLIDRVSNLGEARNNAVHAPALIMIDGREVRMAATYGSDHDRAKKLMGKDILVEFDWAEAWAEELSRYVERVDTGLRFPDKYDWPARPAKPNFRSRADLGKPRPSSL